MDPLAKTKPNDCPCQRPNLPFSERPRRHNASFRASSAGPGSTFNRAAAQLKCPYCGYSERIYDDISGVQERDLEAFLSTRPAGRTIDGHSQETECGGCGAVVILEDNVATDRCPFCATHLENKPRAAGEMVAPESILPFDIDYRKARNAFEQWINDRWFAPDGLRKMASLGQLQGVYLPFWTYDSMTITHYSGRRGTEKAAGMYGGGEDLFPARICSGE